VCVCRLILVCLHAVPVMPLLQPSSQSQTRRRRRHRPTPLSLVSLASFCRYYQHCLYCLYSMRRAVSMHLSGVRQSVCLSVPSSLGMPLLQVITSAKATQSCQFCYCCYYYFSAFNALMLLVGRQEGHHSIQYFQWYFSKMLCLLQY